ncbi:hypothetical protein AZE42_02448 [Rhizopogon vesiculosus]|uniref:Potassium transport protein n=1 Tax=Rhizopogon vesiculosus TaxID=180088 RepID=A0A1J8Q5G0_9AGAM|nr:hypothetical protein AZE42_02448 [Rhizopogon vesiculosus]
MPVQVSTSSSGHNNVWKTLGAHLNFFRIHVIFFTLTPLIFSGILFASNGRYPVTYIDALYNSVSAMTQVLLFIQMCIGNPVIVSWVMVYTRRHYFAKKLDYIVEAEVARRAAIKVEQQLTTLSAGTSSGTRDSWPRRIFRWKSVLSTVPEDSSSDGARTPPKENAKRLRPDMIRRMDAPPKLINPSGWVTESSAVPMRHLKSRATSSDTQAEERAPSPHEPEFADEMPNALEQIHPGTDIAVENIHVAIDNTVSADIGRGTTRTRPLSDPGAPEGAPASVPVQNMTTVHSGSRLPRTSSATVEFAPTVPRAHPSIRGRTGRPDSPSNEILPDISGFSASRPRRRRRSSAVPQNSHIPIAQHPTTQTHRSSDSRRTTSLHRPLSFDHVGQPQEQMLRGFGGFPMPHKLLGMLFGWLFPGIKNRLKRTMTIPVTTTLTGGGLGRTMSGAASEHGRSTRGGSISAAEGAKPVTYISFDAIVGRNSAFHLLTNEQLEELGGVEYRALNALLWLVAGYHVAIQLVSFVVIAPYMSMSKWESDFEPPALFRKVSPPWFSLFQVVSAYTNTGTSLVDQSMVPFQTAYPMIFFMILCILAGNTAFPVIFTDWFSFMVLDIGNPDIDSIPLGTRFVAGLLQAIAVRAAGFGIVPLARIAPAVKVIYVIMMYVSVYPIALSVRSTNVYEEQSLGIHTHKDDSEDEDAFSTSGPRMTVWSRYLAMHARQQLAFDMWWLCLALVLVCIIERGNLDNTEIQGWFNIFTIIFELVSAYGTVGLSLGIPTQNYSFSGALHPLSKLIVCLVMLRGRHRGLPAAIDRAILLPSELAETKDEPPIHATHDGRRSSTSSESPRPIPKEGSAASSNEGADSFEGQLKDESS